MKKYFSSLILLLTAMVVLGQDRPMEQLLTQNTWKLQKDEMSGMGKHSSLANETEIKFVADGTWQSSYPIEGVKSGSWKLKNSELLEFQFGEAHKKQEAKILILNERELSYRFKRKLASYTLTWTANN
ncbi:MAG: hypothetical protein MUE81_12150 [Thermoflexibacter sp.]|jgi:hypothetical protein|nr:hypothetical protein [Thermoflexibacter sp.]